MDFPKNREIDALVPEYTEKGDATHVYLRDGSDYVIDVTLKTVLRFLAYRSCRDICRLREWSAEHTHKRLNNPLPLDEELVLMPYRARHPRVAGDAIMGCVNAAAGVSLKEDEGTLLLTAGGHKLRSLWKPETTQEHLDRAFSICRELLEILDEKILRRLKMVGAVQ